MQKHNDLLSEQTQNSDTDLLCNATCRYKYTTKWQCWCGLSAKTSDEPTKSRVDPWRKGNKTEKRRRRKERVRIGRIGGSSSLYIWRRAEEKSQLLRKYAEINKCIFYFITVCFLSLLFLGVENGWERTESCGCPCPSLKGSVWI